MSENQAREGGRHGVLFVCHANMCRSPLAEGVFRHLATQRGVIDRFVIDSAGTWAIHGVAPHPLSVEVAARHGITLQGSSRSIEPEDLDRFDDIVVMDRRNFADMERLRRLSSYGPVVRGPARVQLLRRFEDPKAQGKAADVPDPVRGGPEHYDTAYSLILTACQALLDQLLEGD